MPMGDLNAASTFLAMRMKLKMEWDTISQERGLKMLHQKIIVGDLLLYGRTFKQLLSYFRTVLNFLKHHHATLKLKKWKWFQYRCKFVGIDVAAGLTRSE